MQLSSHLLFIYLVHHLLWTAVDWTRLVGDKIRQPRAFQLLLLLLAIGLGYLVSNFFLSILATSRSMAELLIQ